MDIFIDYLKQFGSVTPEGENILREKLSVKFLKKDEYFLEAGEVCRELGFVAEGIVRAFYCDRYGNDFTRFFLKERHFAVNLFSFNEESASSEYLQALTDCRLIVISRKNMDYFYANIPEWTGLISRITEKALLAKMEVKNALLERDATERYLYFIEKHPELIQRASLGHIASFLGMTPSSLSRIRKTLSKGAYLSNGKKVPA
jgi:CRP-like cAMP-binding protein